MNSHLSKIHSFAWILQMGMEDEERAVLHEVFFLIKNCICGLGINSKGFSNGLWFCSIAF